MVGIEHLIQWRLYGKRRKEDFKLFIINSLLFISFLFYGVESAKFTNESITGAQIIESVVDISLLVFIAIYFIKKVIEDSKRK